MDILSRSIVTRDRAGGGWRTAEVGIGPPAGRRAPRLTGTWRCPTGPAPPGGPDNGRDSDRGASIVYDWLVNLPDWWQVPLTTGTVGLFSLAVTAIVRRFTAARRGEAHNDVLGHVFATCSIMYAVLVAFVIVDVYGAYQSADRITSHEAETLTTLYLDTERYPDPPRSAMQEAIRQYTRRSEERRVGKECR